MFFPESLLPDGTKNNQFTPPKEFPPPGNDQEIGRGVLYDYWVYKGEFVALVEGVDPGFTTLASDKSRLQEWPMTVFIQGDLDVDVGPEVCGDTAHQLGDKAVFCLASGRGHLFEQSRFLEDKLVDDQGLDGMDAVRQAVRELGRIVELKGL